MKTQITITTQISFLADTNSNNIADLVKLLEKLEHRPSPATSAYRLAISSIVGGITLKVEQTEVDMQAACRVCGCTDGNCEECIEATGEPCHWVADDLCSRCAGTLTSPTDGAQNL